MAALGQALLSFLYPPHCLLCDKLIGSWAQAQAGICPGCVAAIQEQPSERCPRCSSPLGTRDTVASGCPTCVSWPADVAFERAISLGAFEGPLRDAVHALKFKGNKKIGRVLGQWLGAGLVSGGDMRAAISSGSRETRHEGGGQSWAGAQPSVLAFDLEAEIEELDVLIPVPLHAARQRERGYNQAEWIGRGCQLATDVQLISDGLVRARATAQQAQTVSAQERAHNLDGAFVASGKKLETICRGATVGVVDDVLTTGATIDACGRAILDVRPDLRLIAIVAAITP